MNKRNNHSSTTQRRLSGMETGKPFNSSAKLPYSAMIFSLLAVVMIISACSTSTPTATASANQAPTSIATMKTTSLDPCVLITSKEASALTGASYGAGEEGTTSGGGKTCVYGSNTDKVLFIDIGQAADKASAAAAKQDFINELETKLGQLSAAGFKMTDIPSFADGAITSQVTIDTGKIAIYGSMFGFTKGTVFFGFSVTSVGSPSPTNAAMQAEATVVLGRLP